MSVTIASTITMIPKPQARPRFGSMPVHTGRGGGGSARKVCMSDPTKAYKQQLLRAFLADIGAQQRAMLPLTGAVHMTAEFIFARPKSHYRTASLRAHHSTTTPHNKHKRKRSPQTTPTLTARAASMYADHVTKPDIDNLAKSTMDALNAVAYTDDAQVTTGNFSKRWATSPDEPSHIVIRITGTAAATSTRSDPSLRHETTLHNLIPSLRCNHTS